MRENVHRGHNSNSKTKASKHLLYYLRLPSQMAIGKVKRGNERLRDFYENCYVCKPHCIYNRPAVNSNANVWERDLCKNLYQQQQAIYICNPRCNTFECNCANSEWFGKPIFHSYFHSHHFLRPTTAQSNQRKSMPKPPLINNIDLLLFIIL